MSQTPSDAPPMWGKQTDSARRMFAIGDDRMPPALIDALARIKRAAASVNAQRGHLEPARAEAIARAADEVIAGAHPGQFPLHVWQSGSGTQTNMNVNEVIAARATQLLAQPANDGAAPVPIHPNDEVNRGQSSNDVVPAAIQLATLLEWRARLLPALNEYRAALADLRVQHGQVLRLGRTHLQDALPISFGQQIDSYVAQIAQSLAAIEDARRALAELGLGGTAVGTGANAPPGFAAATIAQLAHDTGLPLQQAGNLLAETSAHLALMQAHQALALLASALYKQANDIRWLASGPHGGLGELELPANEPGSSIMPGKVNPTQCEALMMVCCQVHGNQAAMSLGTTLGNFELSTAKPLMARQLMHSTRLLADAMQQFARHCLTGLVPNEQRMRAHLDASLMMVTALAPVVGYDQAAAFVEQAQRERRPLRDVAIGSGRISARQYDELVDPRRLAGLDPPAEPRRTEREPPS
ncbi:MAG TPA: class II fumarate hydratase [Burkholderiaceae bacterium]|nr:class II fumarate hydratase [Burkholderiaceae bacterium]